MEFNNKKLARTSKYINYFISICLCVFLIALSAQLIDDMGEWEERPAVEQFMNKELVYKQKSIDNNIQAKIDALSEKKEAFKSTLNIARDNYKNAKSSYENWLDARKTVGSPTEDKEVLNRAEELDEYYKTEQQWRNELSKVESKIQALKRQLHESEDIVREERARAKKIQAVEVRKYDLNVFLIRLLFIVPILFIGILFLIKLRKHKYWPLFLGFVLFSFYAFFFGLVPYLPSYGGYVRYIVGIAVCILLGMYVINKIRRFIENKKQELKESTSDRAKKVQMETAEHALNNHMCPSCGKDFLITNWDKPLNKKSKNNPTGLTTNFCRFCGLELFRECDNCETENFIHLPFCSNCGIEKKIIK